MTRILFEKYAINMMKDAIINDKVIFLSVFEFNLNLKLYPYSCGVQESFLGS